MKTLTLSHYYTTPDVQQLADYVGDSLDLAIHGVNEKPDRIVFAAVRFMAETAKILNPETEVILPDSGATCSLVTQTDIQALRDWKAQYPGYVHVMYINSSAEMKAEADIIVTSRIVDDVIADLHRQGKKVIFSPDRNMGEYLNQQYGYDMPVFSSVCEVHDKFKAEEIDKIYRHWTDGPKFLLAHPESPLPILDRADFVGSTHGMLKWVEDYPHKHATIFVATEEGLLYNMKKIRPELDIKQAPTYSGCACNSCPYMKMNTEMNVIKAKAGMGEAIDYMTPEQMDLARKPIQRMLDFQKTGMVNLN